MNHVSVRSNPLSLADIMQKKINLSVWSRQPTADLQREASTAIDDTDWRDLRIACAANQVEEEKKAISLPIILRCKQI